jgi:hypothetical protein
MKLSNLSARALLTGRGLPPRGPHLEARWILKRVQDDGGEGGGGAVHDQIDDTIADAVLGARARAQYSPTGSSMISA